MMTFVFWLLLILALILSVPVFTLACQVWLSPREELYTETSWPPEALPGRIAVLVPAHNEEAIIEATLADLLPQLRPQDRLIVVADNCSDNTAALARMAGADVVEREHATNRGKGYALDFGVRHLALDPPDALVIVDADCRVQPGGLLSLARTALQHDRPVQALNLMTCAADAPLKQRIAAWAWRIKNWVRPAAWHRLGWPCQLMGTGMAFPWSMVANMDMANGHLVEDMKLGADLALMGTPPLFHPWARVTSEFPMAEAAQTTQRTRWEHGHLSMLLSLGPGVLWQGVRRLHMPTIAMGLDILVPPVALLGVLLVALWGASLGLLAWTGFGSAIPSALVSALLVLFVGTLWRAWWGWGRDLVSAREWLQAPSYLVAKLPMYLGFLRRRQKAWIRTERR